MVHADYANFSEYNNKVDILEALLSSYKNLSNNQVNWVCNLANAASLIWYAYKAMNISINWAGFYVVNKDIEDGGLILGPFQGKVACQTIQVAKGVCGKAALVQETQLVGNVSSFENHIACDSETRSESVVPIISKDGKTLGVIDIDCVEYNGFEEIDKIYLERLAKIIANSCEF